MTKPLLVDQPTAMPTRKMFMGAVGSLVTAGVQHAAIHLAGDVSWLSWLNTEAAMSALPVIAFFGVGYLMKERA